MLAVCGATADLAAGRTWSGWPSFYQTPLLSWSHLLGQGQNPQETMNSQAELPSSVGSGAPAELIAAATVEDSGVCVHLSSSSTGANPTGNIAKSSQTPGLPLLLGWSGNLRAMVAKGLKKERGESGDKELPPAARLGTVGFGWTQGAEAGPASRSKQATFPAGKTRACVWKE